MKQLFIIWFIFLSLIFNLSVLHAEGKSKDARVSQKNLNSKLSIIKTVPDSILASMTTEELVETLITTKAFIGIGAFDNYLIQQGAIFRSNISQAILKRNDKALAILIVYRSIATKKRKILKSFSYSFLETLISTKEFIKLLTKKEKHEILKLCYKTYIKRKEYMSSDITVSIIYVFANILESEGYVIKRRKNTLKNYIDAGEYWDYQKEILKKCQKYLKERG